MRRLAPHVAAYTSVSVASSRTTETALALPRDSVRTIYNGAPLPTDPAPRPGPGGPVIGAVGRFSPEKGLDIVIEALAQLERGRLVLIGDGDERQRLEALVAALGLVDRVHFAGWVPAPWTASWGFDVLVVPSRSESFGLVAVEAMLAGIPVVATAVGGLPELIEQDETGILVPADDPGAVAHAVHRIVDNADLARHLADTAMVVAQDRFSPGAMASAYESLYAAVADARRGRRTRAHSPDDHVSWIRNSPHPLASEDSLSRTT